MSAFVDTTIVIYIRCEIMHDSNRVHTTSIYNNSRKSAAAFTVPVDLKTPKSIGTSCQIEIHFSRIFPKSKLSNFS